ncbi:MAG TPA: acyltransferase [Fibrobacteraceae bacterium]|nr:acyltransferase [Fibrobacteraceae bacterium]
MPREWSLRLERLRFPLIVGVVFIHAYPVTVNWCGLHLGLSHPELWEKLVRQFFSQGICRIPVPMLFLCSGFLLFRGLERFPVAVYLQKLKSRFRSLGIPYLFWNFWTLFWIALVQQTPFASFFAETYPVARFGPLDYGNALLGVTHAPIAYQLWFVRNLLVLVLLSPWIIWFLRRLGAVYLGGLGFLWFTQHWPLYIPDIPGLFFFSCGGYLAWKRWNLEKLDRWRGLFVLAYLAVLSWDLAHKGLPGNGFVHRAGLLLGILTVWTWSRSLVADTPWNAFLSRWASASFFLYAMHEPMLMVLRKTLYVLFHPGTDILVLLFYFLSIAGVVGICMGLYRLLLRVCPGFLGWITGGRSIRIFSA